MGSIDANASDANVVISATNSYTVYLKSGGSNGEFIYIVANAAYFTGSITNISVKEVNPYDDCDCDGALLDCAGVCGGDDFHV